MNEIDPAIKDLLERARPARPVAEDDWEDVLHRSRRGRRRRLPLPTRGLLLAAAILVGVAAAAQAETGVFQFITDHKSSRPEPTKHFQRLESISTAVNFGILSGLPHGVPRGISSVTWTSGPRMARVFGGTASDYPRAAGVVVARGPFAIPLYLQGCVEIPYACPVPVGNWAWLAYSVLPSPKTGPMSRLPNVRLLRAAPSGTPLPQLGLLGPVATENIAPVRAYVGARQHQGTITVVTRHGQTLAEARVQCLYRATGYTTPLCGALAKYDAYLRKPHPNDAIPASGDWTRVSGTLGGWRGNLVITPARMSQAPVGLRKAITNGLVATHRTPIKRVPPPIDCVVNPIPCFRSIPTRIHKIVEVLNRYGLDARRIPNAQIPARYLGPLPSGIHIEGAATNAGEPTVATRGYVFSMVVDHTLSFKLRQQFLNVVGRRHWGVWVDENTVTLFHPFTPAKGLHFRDNFVGYSVLRGLFRLLTTR